MCLLAELPQEFQRIPYHHQELSPVLRCPCRVCWWHPLSLLEFHMPSIKGFTEVYESHIAGSCFSFIPSMSLSRVKICGSVDLPVKSRWWHRPLKMAKAVYEREIGAPDLYVVDQLYFQSWCSSLKYTGSYWKPLHIFHTIGEIKTGNVRLYVLWVIIPWQPINTNRIRIQITTLLWLATSKFIEYTTGRDQISTTCKRRKRLL